MSVLVLVPMHASRPHGFLCVVGLKTGCGRVAGSLREGSLARWLVGSLARPYGAEGRFGGHVDFQQCIHPSSLDHSSPFARFASDLSLSLSLSQPAIPTAVTVTVTVISAEAEPERGPKTC